MNLLVKLNEAYDTNPVCITEYRLMEPKHVFCAMYGIPYYGDRFRDWVTALIPLGNDYVICRFCGVSCEERRSFGMSRGKTDHVDSHMAAVESALEKFVKEKGLL